MASGILLFLVFLGGIAIGFFFYSGLWLTIQRLPRSSRPGMLAAGSLLLRLALGLLAFHLVMGGRWERLLVCLAGFLLDRLLLVRHLAPGGKFQETTR